VKNNVATHTSSSCFRRFHISLCCWPSF